MERLRGLRGFVQRFGGGDSGSADEVIHTHEQTEEILENLPLTRAFLEQLPRTLILQTSSENDLKALEAHRLITRLDTLLTSHASAARSLHDHVSHLSTLKTSLAAASDHAVSLYAQLQELAVLAAQLEAAQEDEEVQGVQEGEDARFERYVSGRREELERRKEGYVLQLEAFERERAAVVGGGGGGGARRREGTGVGLESVSIEERGEELEDFFGGDVAPVQKGVGRKKVVRAVRGAVMADEDIEEGVKWY